MPPAAALRVWSASTRATGGAAGAQLAPIRASTTAAALGPRRQRLFGRGSRLGIRWARRAPASMPLQGDARSAPARARGARNAARGGQVDWPKATFWGGAARRAPPEEVWLEEPLRVDSESPDSQSPFATALGHWLRDVGAKAAWIRWWLRCTGRVRRRPPWRTLRLGPARLAGAAERAGGPAAPPIGYVPVARRARRKPPGGCMVLGGRHKGKERGTAPRALNGRGCTGGTRWWG